MSHSALEMLSVRPALIIGDDATSAKASRALLFKKAVEAAEVAGLNVSTLAKSMPRRFFDELRSLDQRVAEQIEREYRADLVRLPPALDLKKLADIRWSAVISLASNTCLEQLIQSRLDTTPTSRTLTLVSHPSTTLPARTTPVFRLLGEPAASDILRRIVLSEADLTIRRQSWRALLGQFSDAAKHAVVFIVGVSEDDPLLTEALAALLSIQGPIPTRFVFLGHSGNLTNPTLRGLVASRAEVSSLNMSLQDFCEEASKATKDDKPVAIEGVSAELERLIREYSDVIAVPPTQLPADFEPGQHRTELRDALFRPMSLDWRPFLAGLDFKRDQIADAVAQVEEFVRLSAKGIWPTLLVRGEAGVGKTTFLKRLALTLRQAGHLVLWVKRRPVRSTLSTFREFARKIQEIATRQKQPIRILLFCDDPVSLDLDPEELVFAFEGAGLSSVTVIGMRNSDELLRSLPTWQHDRFPAEELQLRYELSYRELSDLQDFLVSHGMAPTKVAAAQLIASVPAASASKDILCSLWFLVPDSKFQLEASLEDEYLRLGASKAVVESLAGAATSSAEHARRAYEVVAVGSSIDLPIPVEVLVRAAASGSYAEWFDQVGYGKPLWGLLYDDKDPELETFSYRTRNVVVTEILIRLLNQGVGHGGQFRILKTLVAACSGGGALYQDFLTSLLIRRRGRLASFLTHEEGVQLFDLALETATTNQAALLHHKAIWMRERGRRPQDAYGLLEKALALVAADGSQTERRENIHVSMAASVADQLSEGLIAPSVALESVQSHLAQARQRGQFDLHGSHVFANTLFKISCKASMEDPTAVESACRSLSEIERALLSMGGAAKLFARNQRDLELLLDLQRRVVGHFSSEDLSAVADALLQKGNPMGVELRARILLRDASATQKGGKYNEIMELLDQAISKMPKDEGLAQLGLREARATTMIRWRISKPRGAIDWDKFKSDVEIVRKAPHNRNDPVWHYYHALAVFQLGDFNSAMAEFGAIKRVQQTQSFANSLRNFYVGKEGHPKKLQGIVNRSHDRYYVHVSEIDLDVEAPEASRFVRDRDTVHCYLAFRLTGPRAFFGDPSEQNLDLPSDDREEL